MATRYGRRMADGTYEYHDSRASLDAARERSSDRANLFGLIGLLTGGVFFYFLTLKWGSDWPKWLRFGMVIGGAGLLAYVLSKFADWIWNVLSVLLLLGVTLGVGKLIWQAF